MQKNESAKNVSPINVLKDLIKAEGIKGAYSGLSAAVTRQCTYTTLRLGLYDVLREKFAEGKSKVIFNLLLTDH